MQKLLAEEGVIFISIDDTEYASLKQICDEIFGSNCFVSNIAWQRTYSTRNDSKGIVNEVSMSFATASNQTGFLISCPEPTRWMQSIRIPITIIRLGEAAMTSHQEPLLIKEWYMLSNILFLESLFIHTVVLVGDISKKRCLK